MKARKLSLLPWFVVGWMGVLIGLEGCGDSGRPDTPLPPLHPVRGQLLRAGQPVSGGAIRLAPVASRSPSGAPGTAGTANLSIAGQVGPDGRFELTTLQTVSLRSGPGAPVGQYTVTYHPPAENQNVQPIQLPTPVTIQEGNNDLKLDLAPAGKR